MPQGEEDRRFNGANWHKLALTSADAGAWEWDHRRDTVRLCTGAATLLAGDTALAWRDLALDDACARVYAEDVGQLRVKLKTAAYPSSVQFGRCRVRTAGDDVRRVLLRGRTHLDAGGAPSVTMGVVIDVTEAGPADAEGVLGRAIDSIDQAAHHGLAAYNAIQASGISTLLAPARTLLLAIGREIATGLKPGSGRIH